MTRRLAEVAQKVGVSEATVSRVLNGKPGSPRPLGPRLTALDVLGYEGPPSCGGSGPGLVGLSARAAEPNLPGVRRVSETAGPAGFHPVLCTRTPAACRGRVCGAAVAAARVRCGVRGGQFARPTPPTETTCGSPTGNCRPVLVTRVEDLAFPVVPATTGCAEQPSATSVPRATRSAWCWAARPHALAPQASGVSSACRPRGGKSRRSHQHTMFSLEGGTRAASCSAEHHRHRLRQRTPRPRRHPGRRRKASPSRRRVRGRLRRLRVHELHRPAADHRPPALEAWAGRVELLVNQIEAPPCPPRSSCRAGAGSRGSTAPARPYPGFRQEALYWRWTRVSVP